MDKGEEIISKATPNFLYSFLTKWSREEPYFCDDGINLICINQKKSDDSNRTFFLKVIDGSLPSEYFGFLVKTFKTENNDFNCTRKYIKVNGLKILHYQGIPFISTQHLEIKSEVIDFDLEMYVKNLNLKNINKRLEKSNAENNFKNSYNHPNEHENADHSRKGAYAIHNGQTEQSLRNSYERFREHKENLSAEQNIRNYNCSYNEYVKMYGPKSDSTSMNVSTSGTSGEKVGGRYNPIFQVESLVSSGKDNHLSGTSSDILYNKGGNNFVKNNLPEEEGALRNVSGNPNNEMLKHSRKVYDATDSDINVPPYISRREEEEEGFSSRVTDRMGAHMQSAVRVNVNNPKGFNDNSENYYGRRKNLVDDKEEDMFSDRRSNISSSGMHAHPNNLMKYEQDRLNQCKNRIANNAKVNYPIKEKEERYEEYTDNYSNSNRFPFENKCEEMENSFINNVKGEEYKPYNTPSDGRNFDNIRKGGIVNYDDNISGKDNRNFYEDRFRDEKEDSAPFRKYQDVMQNRNKKQPVFYEEGTNTNTNTNTNTKVINKQEEEYGGNYSIGVSKSDKVIMKDNTVGRNIRKIAPYQKSTVLKTTEGMMMPIKKLSQYCSKWMIKARVQLKDAIRKFTTQNKEGQLFTIELCDESGEIRASFFGKAVNKWYDYIEEGKIYIISKGSVKPKNKRYNMLNHDCELSLDENSFIELSEETNMIPKCMYNFTPINQIKNMNNDTYVDVIGIVYGFQELARVFIKKAEEYRNKRDLVLLDESNEIINISLWGDQASKVEDKDLENKCIICFKGAKVKEWQGKKLESSNLTKIEVNPDIERAHNLRKWWIENKSSMNNLIAVKSNKFSIDSQTSIERMQEYITSICSGEVIDKVLIFTIFGIVEHFYNNTPVYPACPKCNKKMTAQNTGAGEDGYGGTGNGTGYEEGEGLSESDGEQKKVSMFCSKCQKDDSPVYNYSLNIKISDSTNYIKASAFANSAKTIMNGISADEFVQIRDKYMSEQNMDNFDLLEKSKLNEFFFRIKVHIASQLDEFKTNYTILDVIPIEKVLPESCKYLIKSINSFSNVENKGS